MTTLINRYWGFLAMALLASPGSYGEEQTSADKSSGPNLNRVKIAAVQVKGYDKTDVPRDKYDAAEVLLPYIRRAGSEGAQLVVFPEYVLGHTRVPGPSTEKVSAAAATERIYVIVGCWEDYQDGGFRNTALLFGRDGQILGKYHKTHAAVDHYEGAPAWSRPPSGKSREWFIKNDPEWVMQRGNDLPVFSLDFGRVGILTCYDGWFPEPARVLSLKGAEIIIWINGRPGTVEDFIVKTTMFQSHVAVVTANQAYGGGTMIGAPLDGSSKILASCPDEKEAYISADIDLKAIRKLREMSRNFQQRRPDLYGDLVKPVASTPRSAP